MIVKLRYGSATVPVDLRGLAVRHLAPSPPRDLPRAAQAVADAVDHPLDGVPLRDACAGARTAAVVVPDATRSAALPETLPPILERLAAAGVRPEATSVVVACGTHPAVSGDALHRLLGPLPPGVRALQHDAREAAGLVEVGGLGPGVPLRVNRVVAEAEAVVTVGTVRHHYFAGFGGGPKLVFPGVAGYEEIQSNHSRVLASFGGEDGPVLDPRCAPGRLEGNPVAEEIATAADRLPPTMAVCFAPGAEGSPAWVAAGSWRVAFAAAVERVREWYEVVPQSFRLVVACAGGAPADRTLIQAHKGLDAACRFAAPGAEVLLVAAVDGGLGSPEMEPFVEDPRPRAIVARLRERWVQYGHTTLRIVDKTARFRVHLHSALEQEVACRLGFSPAPDPAAVVESWRERFPREPVGLLSGAPVYPASG